MDQAIAAEIASAMPTSFSPALPDASSCPDTMRTMPPKPITMPSSMALVTRLP